MKTAMGPLRQTSKATAMESAFPIKLAIALISTGTNMLFGYMETKAADRHRQVSVVLLILFHAAIPYLSDLITMMLLLHGLGGKSTRFL